RRCQGHGRSGRFGSGRDASNEAESASATRSRKLLRPYHGRRFDRNCQRVGLGGYEQTPRSSLRSRSKRDYAVSPDAAMTSRSPTTYGSETSATGTNDV